MPLLKTAAKKDENYLVYCKNCGTINPEVAEYCLKCGRGLGEMKMAVEEIPSPVDVALAARQPVGPSDYSKNSLKSRFIIAGTTAGLVLMVPTVILIKQMGGVAGSMHPATPGQNTITTPGFGGLGLAPGQSPMTMATDSARKANAMKLQTAVAQFYAENDRYPASMAEIPSQTLGFSPDPNIYSYKQTQNPSGYRIEVIMLGSNISGGNIVTEGSVTKYIYKGQ